MTPEEQGRLLQEIKDQFIRGVADLLTLKAKVDEGRKDDRSAPAGMPQLGDYLTDLTRLSVNFHRAVLDMNTAYWERTSEASTRKKSEERSEKKTGEALLLELKVEPDAEYATFSTELTNSSRQEGRFSFFVGEFVLEGAETGVRAPVTINPSRPLVKAGLKEKLDILVPVRGVLDSGVYEAEISVRGPVDAMIVLRLTVQAEEKKPKTKAKTKRAVRKKRGS